MTYGEVRRGLLGVDAQDLTPDIAEALGVDISQGAIVSRVGANSPAAKAGLEAGDVITAIGGEPIYGAADVRNKIGLFRIGDTVELTVLRDGEVHTLRTEVAEPRESQLEGEGPARRLAGATVGPLTEASPLFGKIEGVLVLKVKEGSPAWSTGLRRGDVIVGVNRRPTPTVEAFRKALQTDASKLVLKLRRRDAQLFIIVR